MPDTALLKLYNARTTKKESLPARNPLRLFLPLPPALRPGKTNPALNDFSSISTLRLYTFAALLRGILQAEKRPFELTDKPQEAEIIVYGDHLMTLGPEVAIAEARLALKVEGVIFQSEGNQEGLEVVRGYSLDEVQYLAFGTHYRQSLIISEAALGNARVALGRMHDYAERFAAEVTQGKGGQSKKADVEAWRSRFYEQFNDDLNLPRALAVVWTMFQSSLGPVDKLALLADFDRVLGFGLVESAPVVAAPKEIRSTNGQSNPRIESEKEREKLPDPKAESHPRKEGGGKEKNKPKGKLVTGAEGQPGPKAGGKKFAPGQKNAPKAAEDEPTERPKISSTRQVRSFVSETDRHDFTVSLLAHNNLSELRATVESLLFYVTRGKQRVEVVAVDLGSTDGTTEFLDGVAASYANFRVLSAATNLGEAAGRNLAFRQGRGRFMLLLDAGLTLGGDLFEALFAAIEKDEKPTLYGLYPLQLKRGPDNVITGFEPQPIANKDEPRLEVEALEGSLLCLRRALVDEAGFMDEHFRLPYALDLDYSFAFRDKGFAVVALPSLGRLVNRPAGFSRPTYNLPPEELERQRQKNWNLFLRSWSLEKDEG